MYVKVSFDDYFPYGHIHKLIKTGFQPSPDEITESTIQTGTMHSHPGNKKPSQKTITMSLIDFRVIIPIN